MPTVVIEDVEKAIETLREACRLGNREIEPRYPYVLVRKISRETLSKSGIILPQQHLKGPGKPIGEGVVVRTWAEHDAFHTEQIVGTDELRERLRRFWHNGENLNDQDCDELIEILGRPRLRITPHRKSELSPGDLVLFPQYAGYPADGDADSETNLWFIPDISNADITKVGIFGAFKFQEALTDQELIDLLMSWKDVQVDTLDEATITETFRYLTHHYELVPRNIKPRTRL